MLTLRPSGYPVIPFPLFLNLPRRPDWQRDVPQT